MKEENDYFARSFLFSPRRRTSLQEMGGKLQRRYVNERRKLEPVSEWIEESAIEIERQHAPRWKSSSRSYNFPQKNVLLAAGLNRGSCVQNLSRQSGAIFITKNKMHKTNKIHNFF